MTKLISIIVPVYNTPIRFLKRCLNSIHTQYNELFEIIVINDKSSDEGVNEYLKSLDSKIFTLLQNDINMGLGPTRNKGIEYSSGKYIVFLDSDDYFLDQALNVLIKATNMNNDIVSFNLKNNSHDKINETSYIVLQNKLIYLGVASCSKMYSKSFLLENNQKYPEVKLAHEDNYFFTLNVLSNPSFGSVDDPIMMYEMNNPNSITKKTQFRESNTALLYYWKLLFSKIKENLDSPLLKSFLIQDYGLYFSLFITFVIYKAISRKEYKTWSKNNHLLANFYKIKWLKYLYAPLFVFFCVNFRILVKMIYKILSKNKF